MRFHIPGALREFAGGRSQVEIEHPPTTLNTALAALWTLCPGMRDRVVTEQDEVRPHVNIFVGEENIRYTGGLATRVSADAVISIVPAVSGGKSSDAHGGPIWALRAGPRGCPFLSTILRRAGRHPALLAGFIRWLIGPAPLLACTYPGLCSSF